MTMMTAQYRALTDLSLTEIDAALARLTKGQALDLVEATFGIRPKSWSKKQLVETLTRKLHGDRWAKDRVAGILAS